MSENSPRTNKPAHLWGKGQSGNPGGRPKGLAEYVRKQTKGGKELADFMLEVLRNANGARIPLPVRMDAATWLADRGFGKPVQATEVSGPDGGALELTVTDIRERLTSRITELAPIARARLLPVPTDDDQAEGDAA